MKLPSHDQVERMRRRYPKGTRVELTGPLVDPYSTLKPGDRGTVEGVDDLCNLFVAWDNGCTLNLIPGDSFKRIEDTQ